MKVKSVEFIIESFNCQLSIVNSLGGFFLARVLAYLNFATHNVGATHYYDYGEYYAYGELVTKTDYSENTMTYKTVHSKGHNFSEGHDVVIHYGDHHDIPWGGHWKTPSNEDYLKLFNLTWLNSDKNQTTFTQPSRYKLRYNKRNDIGGLEVRSEENSNVFWFAPFCGAKEGTGWNSGQGSSLQMWTSTEHGTNAGGNLAYAVVWSRHNENEGDLVNVNSGQNPDLSYHPLVQGTYRRGGRSVRGVCVVPIKVSALQAYDNEAFTISEEQTW